MALYLDLARERGLALPPGLVGEAGAMLAEDQGWLAEAGDCAACAWDIGSCRTLAELGYCALPLEPRRWAT
ncbi:MAG: hypothetical protein Q8J98_13635 [Phaeovulum sp.]|uniref:hypothetical protein n=1 Tax=Phaeovulum sp. TaxID=2934796 RepID=UPI0027316336|nr:hypothetical protein [Phaeovulum sp.]MDP2064133.1 hypothetical protein [Phaeovulum sp.]